VAVVRGVDAFRRLECVLSASQTSHSGSGACRSQHSLEHVMSATPEMALRLTAMLFIDDELFADDELRPMLPYLPPPAVSNPAPHGQLVGHGFPRLR